MILTTTHRSLLFICVTSFFIVGDCAVCEQFKDTYHLSLLNGIWPAVGVENSDVRYHISLCSATSSVPQEVECVNSSVCAYSNGTALSLGNVFTANENVSIVPMNTETFNLFMVAGSCPKDGKRARSVINFSCGETLGSPELSVYGDCLAYFNWRTSAACKEPPKRDEVPCYVIDTKGNKMDLTDLIKSTGYQVQTADPSFDFYINVCTNIKDMSGKPCPANSSACMIKNGEAVSVGALKSRLSLSEEGPVLLYEAESNSACSVPPSTKILFRCPKERLQSRPPRLVALPVSCQYEVIWETEYACPERMLVGDIKTCQFTHEDHGVQIDLSPLRKNTDFYQVRTVIDGKKVDFYLNVCGGLKDLSCNGMSWQSVAVCAYDPDKKNSTVIGSYPDAELKYADGQVTLTYSKGKCSSDLKQQTVISFVCGTNDTGPEYVSVDECAHFFTWTTPHACVKGPVELSCVVEKGDKTIDLNRLNRPKLFLDDDAWEILDETTPQDNGNKSLFFMNVCGSISHLSYAGICNRKFTCRKMLRDCGEDAAICMIDEHGKHINLGSFVSNPVYDADIDSVMLHYANGGPCNDNMTWSSSVRLMCLPGHVNNPVLLSVNKENCLYELEWRTAAACPLGRISGSNCAIYDENSGLNVDLTSLKSKVYDADHFGNTYYYHLSICDSIPNACNLGNSTQNVSVCQVNKKTGEVLVLGKTNEELSYVNGYINLTYQATSSKSDQIFYTTIIFLCDDKAGQGKPVFMGQIQQSYEFHWYTDLVCERNMTTSCIVHDPVSHYVYDLSSLARFDKNWETTYSDDSVEKRLYINVCRRLVPGTKCHPKSSACVTEYDKKTGETTVFNVGQLSENAQIQVDNYLNLNYSNGQPCVAFGINTTYTTIVHFVCATDPSMEQGPKFLGQVGNCKLLILWATKAACPTGDIIVNNSCELTDPKTDFKFDLSSLQRENSPYTVSSKSVQYQLNICGPVKGGCFKDDSQVSAENVSVCEASPAGKMLSKLGSSNLYTLQYSKEKDLTIVYEGNNKGSPSAVVRFMCINGTSEKNLRYVKEENDHIFFEMKTALACEAEYFQCRFSDARGNEYDLSPLASNFGSNYVVGDSRSERSGIRYHLNFCRPIHRLALYNCAGGATAACQINIHDNNGTGYSLGTQYLPPTVSDDGTITIHYTNGSNCAFGQFKRSAHINLFCSQTEGVLTFVGETPQCEYIFSMNTPYACPLQTNLGTNCTVTDPVFGYRFDLKPLANNFPTVTVGEYKYLLSVCSHLENVPEKCKGSAVCQTKPLEPDFYKSLGMPSSNLTYNKGILAVKYEFGSENCHGHYKRSSVITFTCDHNATETTVPQFVTEAEDCTYVFEWPTMYACPPIHVTECSVEDNDGHIYDLSKLSLTNDNYYVKSSSNTTFIINVCRSVVHTPDSVCPYYSAACLYDSSRPEIADRAVNIGDAKLGPYIENDKLRLRYSNGQPCKTASSPSAKFYETIIDFICDKDGSAEDLEYIGRNECTYFFDWTTKYACPVGEAKSVGDCVVEDPITGYQYNLSSLKRDLPYQIQHGNHMFSMNICGEVKGLACNNSAGVCQEEMDGKKRHWNAGKSNATLQLSDSVLFLNYSNGDTCHNGLYKRSTIIQFHCGTDESTKPTFLFESTDCTYYFAWTTKLACQFAVHCVVENGIYGDGNHHYDLSPLSVSGVGIARSNVFNDDAVYFINICGSLFNTSRIPCSPSASICRVGLHNDTGENLGTVAYPPFLDFEGHPTTIYNGGDVCPTNPSERSRARIIYLCDPDQPLGSPVLINIDPSMCFYLFEWRTSLVCGEKPTEKPPTVSSCMYKDTQKGIYFDLSSLRKNGSYIEVKDNGTKGSYLLNVCDTFQSPKLVKCSEASICYQEDDTIDNYGALSTQRFTYDGKRLRLKYTNGDDCPNGENGRRHSEIFFVCNQNAGIGVPRLYKKYTCLVVFMWETNIVCRNLQHTCIFDVDGKVFDLHLLSSITHNWKLEDDKNNTYYINLCRGIMQDEETSGCPSSAVVCMKDANGSHMPLGMTYTVAASKPDDKDLLLTYKSQTNKPCAGLNLGEDVNATTRIFFTCGFTQGFPRLMSGPDNRCYFDFSWKTSFVCPEPTKEIVFEEEGILYDKQLGFGMDLRSILNASFVVNGSTSTEYYMYFVNLNGKLPSIYENIDNCESAAVCQVKPGAFNRDIGSYSTRKFYVRGTELYLTLKSLGKPCGKTPSRNVTTVFVMQCSRSARKGAPEFLYESGGCDYVFYWETSAVCPNFNFTYIPKNATADKTSAQSTNHSTSSSHQTAIAMILIFIVAICLTIFILAKAERRATIASKFRVCFSRVSMPRFRYKRVNGERRVIIDGLEPKNNYSVNDDDDNLLL